MQRLGHGKMRLSDDACGGHVKREPAVSDGPRDGINTHVKGGIDHPTAAYPTGARYGTI